MHSICLMEYWMYKKRQSFSLTFFMPHTMNVMNAFRGERILNKCINGDDVVVTNTRNNNNNEKRGKKRNPWIYRTAQWEKNITFITLNFYVYQLCGYEAFNSKNFHLHFQWWFFVQTTKWNSNILTKKKISSFH